MSYELTMMKISLSIRSALLVFENKQTQKSINEFTLVKSRSNIRCVLMHFDNQLTKKSINKVTLVKSHLNKRCALLHVDNRLTLKKNQRVHTGEKPLILAQSNVQLQDEIMLLNSKQSNCSEQVGFSSYGTDINSYSRGQTVVYRHTFLNQGGGYDATTGEFTCRLPGLYVFHVHAQTSGSHQAHLYLIHDYEETYGYVGKLYADAAATTDHQSASTSAVLLLKEGDTVRVRAWGSAVDRDSYFYDGGANSFHGFLVKPDNC